MVKKNKKNKTVFRNILSYSFPCHKLNAKAADIRISLFRGKHTAEKMQTMQNALGPARIEPMTTGFFVQSSTYATTLPNVLHLLIYEAKPERKTLPLKHLAHSFNESNYYTLS